MIMLLEISYDWTEWEEGWRPNGGQLIHTCHSMMVLWGIDDRFASVYRRFDADHAPHEEFIPAQVYATYWTWKKWFPE